MRIRLRTSYTFSNSYVHYHVYIVRKVYADLRLTAFFNAWACQPAFIQISENIVIDVWKPREFGRTEISREIPKNDVCREPSPLFT